ncbi:iron chaperone [Nocardioides hwasunensis]|uniref:DUF1801 domain-containing protein n=1 Tax=Nocardioides hwasunensis TaxID=397258 RepID=A0ABR8MHM3_9ACTN|nr:DUF1801 domain-containing protein [Nocardioides hwasunensis]MBD3914761.1 DUF1801 domain-containing protein [Nocardioides hwasunensis]
MSSPGEDAVEAYIAEFPPDVRARLEQVRRVIVDHLPGSHEVVRYGMPAVMVGDRYGLHFAGWKRHIALYPVPAFEDALESRVAPYRSGKDTVRFLHAQELPYDLVADVCDQLMQARRSP